MRLASVLTPPDDHHLALAAQCGVEEITVRYPGPHLEELRRTKARISAGIPADREAETAVT